MTSEFIPTHPLVWQLGLPIASLGLAFLMRRLNKQHPRLVVGLGWAIYGAILLGFCWMISDHVRGLDSHHDWLITIGIAPVIVILSVVMFVKDRELHLPLKAKK